MTFAIDFIHEILSNLNNDYDNNFDYARFGRPLEEPGKLSLWDLITKATSHEHIDAAVVDLAPYFHGLEKLYTLLADHKSKRLLVQILAYRVMGHKKVKLPLNTPFFWDTLRELEHIVSPEDSIKLDYPDWTLSRMNLEKSGSPVELYLLPLCALTDFILKQYEYHSGNLSIKAAKGDTVIDAGACWGDTALYFANEVGRNGKVYSFEFIPGNLSILSKNLSLNPELCDLIQIIEHPLWSESGKTLYYIDRGPASKLSFDMLENGDGTAVTMTIDDLVKNRSIEKVDFIKMDIEGAELEALKGAIETIREHKPKLAIAIYHRLNDFVEIPEFINSLDLGYRLYIGHYTIHAEETILFCVSDHSTCKIENIDSRAATANTDESQSHDIRHQIFNAILGREKTIETLQNQLVESQNIRNQIYDSLVESQQTLDLLKNELAESNRLLSEVLQSRSWKIGRFFTYPARKGSIAWLRFCRWINLS
jgi:FkbM family methyltransferase